VKPLGTRIKDLRELKAYGQAELAREVGITPTSMWAIEAGRHTPRPATLRKIAGVLGVPVESLTRPAEDD
jgi:transcriptional regulator with XRE-family HTH domain